MILTAPSGGSRILTRDRRGLSGSVMTSPVSHVFMFNIFAAGPLGISYSHQFKWGRVCDVFHIITILHFTEHMQTRMIYNIRKQRRLEKEHHWFRTEQLVQTIRGSLWNAHASSTSSPWRVHQARTHRGFGGELRRAPLQSEVRSYLIVTTNMQYLHQM